MKIIKIAIEYNVDVKSIIESLENKFSKEFYSNSRLNIDEILNKQHALKKHLLL